jgi:SAM-dependent methyltransferase
MNDGASYYLKQSQARGIHCLEDVTRLSQMDSQEYNRLILQHLPKNKDAVIYEAATGPGILQHWLHIKGFSQAEGSDFAKREAELAQLINPRIRHADSIADIEQRFDESSIDAIIALDFYEHIPREAFLKFLAVAASRLKLGGKLILRGPNGDSPFCGLNLYNDITHVWAYTTTSLRALLRLSGFAHAAFADDTDGAIHHGRWWKRPLMLATQRILTCLTRIAIRRQVDQWGMSLYIYATK